MDGKPFAVPHTLAEKTKKWFGDNWFKCLCALALFFAGIFVNKVIDAIQAARAAKITPVALNPIPGEAKQKTDPQAIAPAQQTAVPMPPPPVGPPFATDKDFEEFPFKNDGTSDYLVKNATFHLLKPPAKSIGASEPPDLIRFTKEDFITDHNGGRGKYYKAKSDLKVKAGELGRFRVEIVDPTKNEALEYGYLEVELFNGTEPVRLTWPAGWVTYVNQ